VYDPKSKACRKTKLPKGGKQPQLSSSSVERVLRKTIKYRKHVLVNAGSTESSHETVAT
jgi:hypothetical protein